MALTKRIIVGRRDFLEDGQLRVRTDTVVEEDGVELSRAYHSEVLTPGQSLAGKPVEVSRVASAEWTPEVVSKFEAAKAARNAGRGGGP